MNAYFDYYDTPGLSFGTDALIPIGVCALIGLIGAALVYFLFMPPEKRNNFIGKRALLYIHDLLNFNKLIVISILKYFYIVTAIALTLFALYSLLAVNALVGLMLLIFGNLLWRVIYEYAMVVLKMNENLRIIARRYDDGEPEPQLPPAQPRQPQYNPPQYQQPQYQPQNQDYQYQQQAAPEPPRQPAAPSAEQVYGSVSYAPQPRTCSNCNHAVDADAVFCMNCGTKLQ